MGNWVVTYRCFSLALVLLCCNAICAQQVKPVRPTRHPVQPVNVVAELSVKEFETTKLKLPLPKETRWGGRGGSTHGSHNCSHCSKRLSYGFSVIRSNKNRAVVGFSVNATFSDGQKIEFEKEVNVFRAVVFEQDFGNDVKVKAYFDNLPVKN